MIKKFNFFKLGLTLVLALMFSVFNFVQVQAVELNDNELNLENLESIDVEARKDEITGLGMFFQDLKENISLGLTFDPVKKAQKRLKFAQKRLLLAHNMNQQENDEKSQERLIDLTKRAQRFASNIERDGDEVIKKLKDTEEGAELIEDFLTYKNNEEKVLSQLSQTLSLEKAGEIGEEEVDINPEKENRFISQFLEKENVPEEVREKITRKRRQLNNRRERRGEINYELKELGERYKRGDAREKTEIKFMRQDQAERIRGRMQEMRGEIEDERRDKGTKGNMFFRNIKEKVSLGLTFNDISEAKKRLNFAQERLEIARSLANSDEPEDKKRAFKISHEADILVKKLQENKQEILKGVEDEEKIEELMEEVSEYQDIRGEVFAALQTNSPEDEQQENLKSQQENWEKRQENFINNVLENEKVPEQIRNKLRNRQENLEQKRENNQAQNRERMREQMEEGEREEDQDRERRREREEDRIEIPENMPPREPERRELRQEETNEQEYRIQPIDLPEEENEEEESNTRRRINR